MPLFQSKDKNDHSSGTNMKAEDKAAFENQYLAKNSQTNKCQARSDQGMQFTHRALLSISRPALAMMCI